ncbi:hypothetical protein [Sulfurovum sp. NBC37-1]|nr:hypothetical protein [Sulfurovum sp. NBC37-1]
MDWLTLLEIGSMFFTAYLIFLLIKEFKKSIRESKQGKVSGRCDLD